jgi:hypothetical protein
MSTNLGGPAGLQSAAPSALNDDLQKALDFARGQADAEIASIERLFGRAKTMFGWIVVVAVAMATFLGLSTYFGLQTLVTTLVSEGMKRQVPEQIEQQLKKQNIEKIVQDLIQKKTENQFQAAINTAVTAQLDTPQRQKILEAAVQRQVDAWFSNHQQVLQAAAQKQVDLLTEHLQNR